MTNTTLYKKYCGIKDRCYNKNNIHYARYGGRGIVMCNEWKHSFDAFKEWAYANGYVDNKSGWEQTIDRIDPNGNYEPTNCRWSNRITQSRNKENTIWIDYKENRISAREFAEQNNIRDYVFVFRRIKKGDSTNKILHDWNMIHHTSDDYMTVDEAARHYGVSKGTIKSWISGGKISAEKCGNRLFIPKNKPRIDIRDE